VEEGLMLMPPAQAVTTSGARFGYQHNPTDDLFSLRRYLSRIISPSASGSVPAEGPLPNGEPWFYVEPDEGKFMRPAVTIQLVDDSASTYSPSDDSVVRRSHYVEHAITIKAYGSPDVAIGGRADTIRLGDLVWKALDHGGSDLRAYRPNMWSFDMNALLARRMRVLRTSLSMALADTDDEGRWVRSLNFRVVAPRVRPLPPPAPIIQRITV
jgi:hypothetical protein